MQQDPMPAGFTAGALWREIMQALGDLE